MKKIIVLLFMSIMFSHLVFAATDIDLKSLSTEDLVALRQEINQELADRGEFKSATVPAGKYSIGTDIPAGEYSVSTSQILTTVTVNGYEQMYAITPKDGVGKITLKEGDSFETSSTVILEQYSGITFE